MRLIDSAQNLQFTAKHYTDNRGWVVVVTNEDDVELRLDSIPLWEEKLTAEQFAQTCARWLNKTENIDELRGKARAAMRRMQGMHVDATPFTASVESQLDEIARVFGRNDVYLGTSRQLRVNYYVVGPWLRGLTGERHYYNASKEYVLKLIAKAYRRATAPDVQPNEWQQLRLGQLPVGAMWVAHRAARAAGIDEGRVRVVDVGSIGNGGHVVTWTDQKTGFYVTEDYNNIDIFRS